MRRFAALLAAAGAFASGSRAASPVELMIVATSDYVHRGVSQTYGEPALQGAINYRHSSGWYVGAWISNVEPYPFGARFAELNLYAGRGWPLTGRWYARAGYTRYSYVSDARPVPYDYGELQFSVSFDDWLTAAVSFQPDGTGYSTLGYVRRRNAGACELSARAPLARGFSLVAGLGRYATRHIYGADYAAGQAGVSWARGRMQVDALRFAAEPVVHRLFGEASADGRWAVSVALRY